MFGLANGITDIVVPCVFQSTWFFNWCFELFDLKLEHSDGWQNILY